MVCNGTEDFCPACLTARIYHPHGQDWDIQKMNELRAISGVSEVMVDASPMVMSVEVSRESAQSIIEDIASCLPGVVIQW